MDKRDFISKHECLIYLALRDNGGWLSNKRLGELLDGQVKPRTIRYHTRRFKESGILSEELSFPGFLYKLTSRQDYAEELERAAGRMGL